MPDESPPVLAKSNERWLDEIKPYGGLREQLLGAGTALGLLAIALIVTAILYHL